MVEIRKMKQIRQVQGSTPAMKNSSILSFGGLTFSAFTVAALLTGCEKEKPEQVTDVKVVKKNAIELVASTARLPDGRFVVHLHKNLYNNSQLIGVDTLRDTLPDLGMESVNVEDENGESSRQTVPVQYNILFKVDSLKK
jgi:hypothetical protein